MEVSPPFENRPDTWLHPNASQIVGFLLHRGRRPYMALNVIHGAAKVWSLSDQQRTNCAVGLDWLRSV
jgi:hypothetical protein